VSICDTARLTAQLLFTLCLRHCMVSPCPLFAHILCSVPSWCCFSAFHSVRYRASLEPDFDTLMAHLHITPPVATSLLMTCHPPPALARHTRALSAHLGLLAAHSVAYIGWSGVCVLMNGGHWPYPFQARLGLWGHAALDSGVLAAAAGMATAAHKGVHRKVQRYASTGGMPGDGGGAVPCTC